VSLYRIHCYWGSSTTTFRTVETWATDVQDAYDKCRRSGYVPARLA